MTIKEVEYILRNAAWLGTNEDREATEAALEMAIAALEKQEGEKPVIETEEINGLVEGCPAHRQYSLCPSCRENLRIESWTTKRCFGEGTILKNNKKPNYCPICGQIIDWTEGE